MKCDICSKCSNGETVLEPCGLKSNTKCKVVNIVGEINKVDEDDKTDTGDKEIDGVNFLTMIF